MKSFSWFRFGKRNSLYIKQYSLEPVEIRRFRIIATFWVFKVHFGTIINAVRACFNRKDAENCIIGVICGFYRIQINAAIQIWSKREARRFSSTAAQIRSVGARRILRTADERLDARSKKSREPGDEEKMSRTRKQFWTPVNYVTTRSDRVYPV